MEPKENDADSIFYRSLVSTLQSFPKKKNKLAKITIQQLLFDLEFEGDDNNDSGL